MVRAFGVLVVAALLGHVPSSQAQTCVENTICDAGSAGPGFCRNGVCTQHCCNLDAVCGAPCPCQGQVGEQSCFQGVCRCCVGGPSCPSSVCDLGPLECVCSDKTKEAPCGQACCAIGSLCVDGVCTLPTDPADLSITKVWTYGALAKQIVFTLRVENAGPGTATSVTIVDPLSSKLQYVSATPPCSFAGPGVVCTFPSLNPGERRVVDIVTKRTEKGGFENSAAVAGQQSDPSETDNEVTIPVLLGGDCRDKVRLHSVPPQRHFTPTETEPSRRRAIVVVKNANFEPIDVLAIEPLGGAPFTIEGVQGPVSELPVTIPPRSKEVFLVHMVRPAGADDAVAKRPYFRVTISCFTD
jgi:uncharacterized repeat protein (TIGR01451 family)